MILPYGDIFLLKDHMDMLEFFPFNCIIIIRIQCLSISRAPISFIISSKKSRLVASLKLKVSITDSLLEARGLFKLEILYGEYLALSPRWISLSEKSLFLEEWDW